MRREKDSLTYVLSVVLSESPNDKICQRRARGGCGTSEKIGVVVADVTLHG